MGLRTVPVSFAQACAFVAAWHRHHRPPTGHKFSIGVATDDGVLVGVAMVGRPVARLLDDGHTLPERVATDGHRNACSLLYAAAWQAARALGYRRLVTYTQAGESGASLRAAGWRVVAARPPAPGWSRPSRPRDDHGVDRIARLRWQPPDSADTPPALPSSIPSAGRAVGRARVRHDPSTGRPPERPLHHLGRSDTMSTPPPPIHHEPSTSPADIGASAVATRVTAPARRPPWRGRRPGRATALLCFVVLAAAANAVAYHHPLVPVGFGLSATPVAFAVAVIDAPTRWLHRCGGQRLVFAAILTATVVSCAVAGPFGLAWGIAYLAAELVGLCTWRRWADLRARPVLVSVGALLELPVQVSVYVWLLAGTVAVTVPGQVLGTAWGLLALAALITAGRVVRLLRHSPPTVGGGGPGTAVGPQPPCLGGPRQRPRVVIAAIVVFATAVAAANWLTARYGLIAVGLGLTATAGTYAAGLCLLARDWVHDAAGRVAVLAAIGAGGAASAVMAGPRLALASAAAFVVSELADLLVYQPLRRRGWALAVLASGAVGAPVDTVLFLALAGFPIWAALPGQLLAKATATAIPVAVVLLARALLRHRLRPQGA